MRRRRIAGVLLVTVLVVVGLGAVGAGPVSAASQKPVKGGSVNYLNGFEPRTFDIANVAVVGPGGGSVGSAIYDNLIRIDPETNAVIPRLAASVSSNADASVWTIKMKPNLKFTDGSAVDAAALKATWDHHLQPEVGSTCRPIVQGFGTWTVTEPLSLQVKLPTPLPEFPIQLGTTCASGIQSAAAMQKYGSSYGTSPETTVGAGPFVLKEWFKGDHFTAVRNPGFWDAPRPYVDQIVFKTGTLPQQSLADALIAGQTDMMQFNNTAGTDLARLEAAGAKAYGLANAGGLGYSFNLKQPPLDDLRVRQALVYASNPKDVDQKVNNGTSSIVTTYFDKTSPYYNAKIVQHDNNVAKGQKLIDAYLKDKGVSSVDITMLQPSGFAPAQALQQQWSQLKGVNIIADVQPSSATLQKLLSGNYQTAAAQLIANTGVAFDVALNSQRVPNLTGSGTPELDAQLNTAKTTLDKGKRKTAIDEITKILFDQAYYVFLTHPQQQTWVAKKLKGVTLQGPNCIDLTTMYLAKS
jgi:ABC-type transport system substrate-binding protein